MHRIVRLAITVAILSVLCAAQNFSSALRYSTQESIDNGFVIADVNGDGYSDLVAIQANTHSIAVLLNDKSGALHQTGLYNAGADPVGIVVGDFDGDHKLDVAVANYSSGTVSVLIGNGDGSFRAPVPYTVYNKPNSLAVGDFNNDCRTDIAALSSISNRITILTNTGSSFTRKSFAPPQHFSSTDPNITNDFLSGLKSGDFNNDGRMDLAYVDSCGSDACGPAPLEVLYTLFNTTSGWQAHQAASTTGAQLRVADVDNDGRSDVISVYHGCHTPCTGVDVYYSNGDGTFSGQTVFSGSDLGGDPYDAVVADFNNDGINDIASPVMAGQDPVTFADLPPSIAVYTNKGGRDGFNAPKYFATGDANDSLRIDAGFLRAQTRKDIIVDDAGANNAVELRNTASTTAEPCKYPVSPAVHYCGPQPGTSVTGPSVRFTATARGVSNPVNRIELWIDGQKRFQTHTDRLDRSVTLSTGQHAATVVEVDAAGGIIKSNPSTFTVK